MKYTDDCRGVWEPMAAIRTRLDVLETIQDKKKKIAKKLLASLGPNSVGFSCSVADLTTTPLCLSA